MKRYIFTVLFFLIATAGISQQIPEGITNAFKTGDAKQLSTYFYATIEMQVLNEINIASRDQATRIMQEFFKTNPPLSFEVNYEDFKLDSKYSLGTLVTRENSFRINIYFMEIKKEKFIYYLNIEKN